VALSSDDIASASMRMGMIKGRCACHLPRAHSFNNKFGTREVATAIESHIYILFTTLKTLEP
jgi:hypothetical protein